MSSNIWGQKCLDGFLGYNQVLVEDPERLKTMFCTKWGMFAFHRMSFGLVNMDATFQWAMKSPSASSLDRV